MTLAGLLIKDLWFRTVKFFEADTIACLVAENLPTRAVLDSRADAFTMPITVPERRLTYSIVVTLTPASVLAEDSWPMAQYSPWTFTLACISIEDLTTWALPIDTLTLASTWVQLVATWTPRDFASLASTCWPIKVVRPWAFPRTAID